MTIRTKILGALGAIHLFVFGAPFLHGQSTADPPFSHLEPYRSIEMSPVDAGVIGEIFVAKGESVQEGQPLLKLDDAVLQARLALARARAGNSGRIDAARAEFEAESNRLQRLGRLRQGGTSNTAEYERQEADVKISEGNLNAEIEQVGAFKLQAAEIEAEIEQRILRSPIDGVVTDLRKDVAESVSPTQRDQSGEDYVVRVVQLDKLKAELHLPFTYSGRIGPGSELKFRLEDGGDRLRAVAGTVEYVAPVVNPATGTVEVRVVFDNRDGLLPSGVRVTLLPEGS